jgi:calpain-7
MSKLKVWQRAVDMIPNE